MYAEISDDLRPYIPDDDDDLWWEYYNQYANAWEFINALDELEVLYDKIPTQMLSRVSAALLQNYRNCARIFPSLFERLGSGEYELVSGPGTGFSGSVVFDTTFGPTYLIESPRTDEDTYLKYVSEGPIGSEARNVHLYIYNATQSAQLINLFRADWTDADGKSHLPVTLNPGWNHLLLSLSWFAGDIPGMQGLLIQFPRTIDTTGFKISSLYVTIGTNPYVITKAIAAIDALPAAADLDAKHGGLIAAARALVNEVPELDREQIANLSILEAIEAAYAQHYVVVASAGYRSTTNNYSCIQTKVQDPKYGPIVSFRSFNKVGTGTDVYMTVEDDVAVANAFAPCNAGIVYIYVPAGAETQFRLFRKDWNLHRDITLTAGQWNRVEFDIDFVVNESIAGFMIQFVNPVDGLKLSGIYGVK